MIGSPDLMEGIKSLDDALPYYKDMWQYFAQDLPERFASARLRNLIEGSGRDYRFRLARVPVEALANRVGINSIISSRGDAVNAKIEEIRQGNDMELQEPFLHERVFVLGDSYLFLWPTTPEQDPDDAVDQEATDAGVEFVYQSPMSCRAIYDGDDGRRVRFVIRRWREDTPLGKIWRAEVWYADRVEPWISIPGASGNDPNEWLPYAEDEFGVPVAATDANWPQAHDWGEIPIKHARSDLPYGRSEIEDFIGAQNLVTKATVTQASGIESHGWRERYRIADDKAILEQASDIVPWGDDADAPSATTAGVLDTPVSGRRSGPGTEQTFHGTKAVGEYAATDIGSMIDPLEQWVRFGAAASGTPLSEFDPRFGANMSGVAWDRAERPMKKKEADRKRFFLRFWREVYGLALAMVGVSDPGEITVNWAPPEVISDPEWWTTATVRRDHGVPQKAILLEANYTEDQIQAWLDEQDEEATFLDRGIDRLARLGDALQKLGAGATLIGIPSERIATLVETLLGEAGSRGRLVLEEAEPPAIDPNNDQGTEDPNNGDKAGVSKTGVPADR